VDVINCKRNILKCYSTQNQEQSSKETRENSKPKTGAELDVKRKSPYEGLSAGQKGKGFWHYPVISIAMLIIFDVVDVINVNCRPNCNTFIILIL
jgi:hypothetical protein